MSAPPISDIDLIANIRGVLFAAYAPIDVVAKLIGSDVDEAEKFQRRALDQLAMIQVRIKRAKAARA